jgi:tryptophan-rich sensory protein
MVSGSADRIALAVCAGICFGVMFIGSGLTSLSVGSWYTEIAKPSWTPPGWTFGVVWPMLYALMEISLWLLWRASDDMNRALWLFAAQLTLNLAWSGLFFGLRSPVAGLVGIVLLLALIVATMVATAKRSRAAAYLLVPYVLWVSFATALNTSIWRLNGG